ncbi:MAG: ABC transporter permease [Gemmatimonadota bacterium]
MSRWLAGRIVQGVVTFLIATTLLFFLMRLTPGDPLQRVGNDRPMAPAELARLRKLFGLDQPLAAQFGSFVGAAVRGDLGVSIEHYPDRVGALIRRRLPASFLLGGAVLFVNFTLGLWIGVRQARRRGTRFDRWLSYLTLTAYAVPAFWLGLVLITLFSIEWRIFPAALMRDPLLADDASFGVRTIDLLRHLFLPALTLAIVTIAGTIRYQRAAMVDALRQPFIRAARARGLAESRVIWRHAWRSALGPVLTLLGLWLPLVVSGAVFVEAVFSWPGLGSLAAQAIGARDYPVVLGTSMLVTLVVILGSIVTDIGHRVADPRVGSS